MNILYNIMTTYDDYAAIPSPLLREKLQRSDLL